MSLSSLAYSQYYGIAAAAVAVLIVAAVATGWLMTRRTQLVIDTVLVAARRFSKQNKIKAEKYITTMAEGLNRIKSSPKQVAYIVLFGALNWVLDAASLWVILMARVPTSIRLLIPSFKPTLLI